MESFRRLTESTNGREPPRGAAFAMVLFSAGCVFAACGGGDSPSTPAPPTTPVSPPSTPPAAAPAVPGGLRVSGATRISITWTWNAVEGAALYRVQVSTDEVFDDTDRIEETTETVFTVAPLRTGATVHVRVQAVGAVVAGRRPESAWTTHVTGTAENPVLPTPAGLMVSATTRTSITWTWNPVEGAILYLVQVSRDGVFEDTDPPEGTSRATFTLSSLPPETTVHVRVRAVGDVVEGHQLQSAWTVPVTGTSRDPELPPPSGLRVSGATFTSVTWTWDAVAGAVAYRVQVSVGDVFDVTGPVEETTDTSFTVSSLTPETAVHVRVMAVGRRVAGRQAQSAWTTFVEGVTAARNPATEFLTTCPTPAELREFHRDLDIRFIADPTADRPLACTRSDGSADLTVLQMSAYQTLRLMRAAEFSEPLPWTDALYDWFSGTVRRIDFNGNARSSFADGDRIQIGSRVDWMPDGRVREGPGYVFRYFDGAIGELPAATVGQLSLLVHEARHTEGVHHTCGSRDEAFAEMGAFAYAALTLEWFARRFLPAGFFSADQLALMERSRTAMCRSAFCSGGCPE